MEDKRNVNTNFQEKNMKKHSVRILFIFFILHCFGSCSFPNGISIGPVNDNGEETIILDFKKVALKFDLSKKLNTAFINGDYGDLIVAHNANDINWSNYSGTIDVLSNILVNEESYDEDHKPSITVIITDLFNKDTTHRCKKEDISWNKVLGIPNNPNLYQATIEIKSIKTRDNGVQVIWKKTAFIDNWPINEFVENGTIKCDVTSITKVGTNNDNGNVAARGNTIISNTSNRPIKIDDRFIEDDIQLISPDLRKPVLVNGDKSTQIKWSEPVIYKAI